GGSLAPTEARPRRGAGGARGRVERGGRADARGRDHAARGRGERALAGGRGGDHGGGGAAGEQRGIEVGRLEGRAGGAHGTAPPLSYRIDEIEDVARYMMRVKADLQRRAA
ncbi:hypothetical protein GTH10_29280, partial [Burkholderia thailandensis]|nr:hypothetical protein [Burkholderia thailandensis]